MQCIYQVLRAGAPDGINDSPRYGMSKILIASIVTNIKEISVQSRKNVI